MDIEHTLAAVQGLWGHRGIHAAAAVLGESGMYTAGAGLRSQAGGGTDTHAPCAGLTKRRGGGLHMSLLGDQGRIQTVFQLGLQASTAETT